VNTNCIEETDDETISNSHAAHLPLLDTTHGGCWLDSFIDNSKIDWEMSDKINTSDGNVKIDVGMEDLVFIDTFSAPLNTNEWKNNTGGGMTLFTYPFLRAEKTGQAQTFNSYIETKKLWNGYRIVEWEWNPYYDSASNSFGHAMIFYVNGSKNLVLGIPANRVMYIRNEIAHLYDAPFPLSANTWYNMKMILGPDNITFKVKNPLGSLIIDTVVVSSSFDINYASPVTIYFASQSAATGFSFDTRVDNFKIFQRDENLTGNLTTKQIVLPFNMHWDTLIINKTQSKNAFVNISILNASDNQPIQGSPLYINDGEFDVSYIDPIKYPSIKLNATFIGDNWNLIPTLHYWGISWNSSNSWQDSFFGGEKVERQLYLDVFDGKVQAMRNKTEFEVDSNTVALWHFNEGSGVYAYDETDYNHHGTLGGDGLGTDLPTWTNGMFENGLSFDGINDYMIVSDTDELSIDNTGVLTVEFWIKTGNDINTRQDIICKGGQSTSGPWEWFILIANGKLKAIPTRSDTGGSLRIEEISITRNSWHYIAVIFTGVTPDDDIEIYLNGIESSMFVQKYTNTYSNTNGDLGMGRGYGNSKWNQFSGILDEIRISKVARTPQEIKDYYRDTKYSKRSILESETISIPVKSYYKRLIINKSEPSDNYLNVTILDGQMDIPIQDFEKLSGGNIDISSINPFDHPSIKLRAIFESNREETPILYDWSINWTKNTAPRFIDIKSPSSVNRTKSVQICVNVSDREESEYSLALKIEYKSPSSISWQTNCISTPYYTTDHWSCTFTPPKKAELGYYSLRITVNDSFQYLNITTHLDLIEVINNKPTAPDVSILPLEPRTTDDLIVIAENSTDIDINYEIGYWRYCWFRNGVYLEEFDNKTMIPNTATQKGEKWRCLVYKFDGDDFGFPGEAEVVIQNSPPELIDPFDYHMMVEDFSTVFENKLNTIFRDKDNDKLTFSAEGQKNITINIFQDNGTIEIIPKENWFGMEYIKFYANDTSPEQAENALAVQVEPANDLPKIVSVGNQLTSLGYPELEFIVNQNEWLNLTISVSDIDGDVERGMIIYVLNITLRDNLYVDKNQLIFHPTNNDVGLMYIDIKVTDNNETPIVYITQPIRIQVLNVNDPPTVEIISPKEVSEFSENEKFTLICISDDPDFEVLDYSEKHEFRWYTNRTEVGDLGYGQQVINVTLKPGYYTIYIEVMDLGNAKAYDSIEITIKEAPRVGGGENELLSNILIWIGLIIVIIIFILIILLFYIMRKKEKDRLAALGIPEQEVLQPDAAYQPGRQLPAISSQAPLLMTQGAPQVTASAVAQPTPQITTAQATPEATTQLPPVQPTVPKVQMPTLAEEQKMMIDSTLTPQQKLELIEERFIRGEMDQDIYLSLKAKYEFQTKPFEPAPQLPPMQAPSISTPTPVPEPRHPSPSETIAPEQELAPPDSVEPPMEQPTVTESPAEPTEQPSQEVPPGMYQPQIQSQPQPTPTFQQPTVQQPPQTPTTQKEQRDQPSQQAKKDQNNSNDSN
jgi:hypothetical protein